MLIIGIDPGRTGGVATIEANAAGAIVGVGAVSMPDGPKMIVQHLRKLKTTAMHRKSLQLDDAPGIICYLEEVHAMPATREEHDRSAAPNLCQSILGRYDEMIVRQLESAGVGKSVKPLQGIVGTFTFAKGFGVLIGILETLEFQVEMVRPQDWQAVNGCRTRGDKNVSKRRAIEIFRQMPKITHATADALLIANYGYKLLRSDQLQGRAAGASL